MTKPAERRGGDTRRRRVRVACLGWIVGLQLACGASAPVASQPDAELLAEDDAAASATSGLSEGEAALSAGDFARAREIFAAIVRDEPGRARAHHYLGVSQDGLGDVQAATLSYRKALELDPKLLESSINLSAALLDGGDAEGALQIAEAALRDAPDEAALLFNRALALEALGRQGDALGAYREALRVDSGNASLRYAYAEALLAAGSRDEALGVLQELARGESVDVLASTARLLGRLREFALCVTTLDRAIGMRPAPELFVDRGLCKHGLKDEAGALADFEEAIVKDGSFAPAHYYLGMHLKGLGRTDEARAALSRAVEIAGEQRVGKAARRALEDL